MNHQTAAWCAGVSAVLLWISGLFYVRGYYTEFGSRDIQSKSHMSLYQSLDPATLTLIWAARRDARHWYLVGEMIGAFAWFLISIPVGSMCALLGGATRSSTRIVSTCFSAVAYLTLIEMTFQAGTVGMTDWLSTWPIMMNATARSGDGDIGPLQALEISYLVGQSRTTWIFAMDEFLMCVGCAVTAWLTLSSARGFSANPLSKKWAGLTALLSFVTLISFLLNATRRLAWFKLSIAAGLGMAVIYMVLLPIWLIWLGMQLSERSEAVTYMGGTGDMDANVNMASKSAAGPSVDVEMSSVGHSGDVV